MHFQPLLPLGVTEFYPMRCMQKLLGDFQEVFLKGETDKWRNHFPSSSPFLFPEDWKVIMIGRAPAAIWDIK